MEKFRFDLSRKLALTLYIVTPGPVVYSRRQFVSEREAVRFTAFAEDVLLVIASVVSGFVVSSPFDVATHAWNLRIADSLTGE